jgi:hypothetical protein
MAPPCEFVSLSFARWAQVGACAQVGHPSAYRVSQHPLMIDILPLHSYPRQQVEQVKVFCFAVQARVSICERWQNQSTSNPLVVSPSILGHLTAFIARQ